MQSVQSMRQPNGYPSQRLVVYTNGIYYVYDGAEETACKAAFAFQPRFWSVLKTWLLLLPQLWKLGRLEK